MRKNGLILKMNYTLTDGNILGKKDAEITHVLTLKSKSSLDIILANLHPQWFRFYGNDSYSKKTRVTRPTNLKNGF
jgi:hypothetical protein